MNAIDTVLHRRTATHEGQPVDYEIPVTAYPCDSGRLLIISPGSGELKDGRHDRWRKLAEHLRDQGLCATVTYNAPRPDFQVQLEWEAYSYRGASWNRILMESVCHVADWSLERSAEICGAESPEICMAGFSSGGSAVGAVAHLYPQVKQLLLLSTYDSVGDPFYEGVSLFTGDIFMGLRRPRPARRDAGLRHQRRPAVLPLHGRPAPSPTATTVSAAPTTAAPWSRPSTWALGHDDTFPETTGAPAVV